MTGWQGARTNNWWEISLIVILLRWGWLISLSLRFEGPSLTSHIKRNVISPLSRPQDIGVGESQVASCPFPRISRQKPPKTSQYYIALDQSSCLSGYYWYAGILGWEQETRRTDKSVGGKRECNPSEKCRGRWGWDKARSLSELFSKP